MSCFKNRNVFWLVIYFYPGLAVSTHVVVHTANANVYVSETPPGNFLLDGTVWMSSLPSTEVLHTTTRMNE